MTCEGLGEMFEGDSADTAAVKFPLMSVVGAGSGRPGSNNPYPRERKLNWIFTKYLWNLVSFATSAHLHFQLVKLIEQFINFQLVKLIEQFININIKFSSQLKDYWMNIRFPITT